MRRTERADAADNSGCGAILLGCNERDSGFEKFFEKILGGYQSGQMGQTVNLLSFDFGGSNPSPPTVNPVRAGESTK